MRTDEYFDPEIEMMKPGDLQLLQQAKLAAQLDYLFARSAFYREKFAAAGIRREDFCNLKDLARFPFTAKEELRESQQAFPPLGSYMAADMKDVIRLHASTGTTGRPSFVGLTRKDAEIWTKVTARSFYTQGIRPSDIVIHATSLTMFAGGLPSKDAIELIGATFVPVGTGASEKVVLYAMSLHATAIHCTPSYAIYLADYVRREAKMDPRELGIKKFVCGAEPGAGIPAVRAKITEEWGARVTEGLGNADMVPIIFAECPDQSGMHYNGQEYVYNEIIDPESGEVLPIETGVSGELVYTSLERECSPLLRFRTRDRVTILGTSCKCGRTSYKLRCVGRTDDMLIVLGVNVFPSAVRDVVSSFYPRMTGEVQILLDQPGPGVKPPLRVMAEVGTEAQDQATLQKKVEEKIKSVLTVPAAVQLVPAGTLPRFEMKGQLIRKLFEER
ncbi:MAG: phenylacetate--CoA ligase family protein [Acidobacteriia bacterium]|nr:phenylacetate--CoA ligase family protein [Terriglobia bacterium]